MNNSKKILVLGGCGYVGTTLCKYLTKNNYHVTVVDLCWFGNNLPKDIPVINKDIFDIRQNELVGYDAILFLAGLSNDPMAEFSPKDNFIYNTALPAYIGFIAKEAGVKKLIFASSCSVYGYTFNRTFTEDDLTASNYPYGISKLQGEKTLNALADENFSVICLRQGTISGYSDRMRLDLAINTMFKNALQNNEIVLTNSKIWRPILGLEDLCEAYKLAIETKLSGKETFNIRSFNITIGELALEVAQFVKSNFNLEIKIINTNTPDYRNYKVSIEKAENILNYKPNQTVQNILIDLKNNLANYKNFKDDNFYNINVFKQIMLNKEALI